ncbi:uncharacterized protein TNCV_3074101 [Trichonephila clavipes]|uniref:CCHC-type domain-containing protein n=1 Tax=Trichonephila clavipes TaxID=2585209 RepID=A0A8X6SJZ3_TRICX|nr:uncharacterized protein TNCV_3074101 [Trichonephila clavipes]
MSKISPFAIHKTLIGIGGEPKSVKRLRSGDLLIETISDLQTKSFLLAKTFFNSPVTVSPHKTLNSCRGVISEPDLLSTPDAEILEGFSDQDVIQVRRITLKRDSNIIPTKHIILTFNKPKLPTTVKAGYLNCKIRPYIPNPLRCFKCQRFGHSQTSCRGQLTCSRCASVGHSSTDCTLEPKCVNCTQSHPSDSKLCQKWKIEKQIQELKTNRNISYFEARRLIVPQLTQTEHSTAAEAQQIVKRKSRNRRKRSKIPKPNIEIKRVPHRSRNATPTEITTDDEDMITYDVEEEELEQDPFILPEGNIQIPVVSEVRFLGVIFDCKLTFLPHVLYLWKKCERSLNILKVLSITLWGADRVSLLRVYQALILSRLDYGCVVYGSARASVLKRLDTIHHSALRICSGVLRTSPVTSLYVVCHQPPLELRRRQLSANYFIRAMSVPSHPLKPFALAISLNRLYKTRSFNIKPFSEKAKAVLF